MPPDYPNAWRSVSPTENKSSDPKLAAATLKILILKPSSLGDVIQALPVLRLIKQCHPQSRIYWWLARELLPLLAHDPDLEGVIPFDRKRWAHPSGWLDLARSLSSLRHHQFDWVIDLQSLARSGLVAWLSRARLTVGLDDSREGASAFYDVAVPRPSPKTHAVEWYLRVLDYLNIPVHWNFTWLPAHSATASHVSRRWPLLTGQCLALHPGARWENKRWPISHFVTLAQDLSRTNPEIRFVVLGSGADTALGEQIAKANPGRVLNLAGQTTLLELIECLRVCQLLVCNDTGPMHIAAALGKPVIGLFGPTNPWRTGPYGQIDSVLKLALPCQPCMKATCHHTPALECLTSLPPNQVAARVRNRLAKSLAAAL